MVDAYNPAWRLLYADYTVLCSAPDGTIEGGPMGLFQHDTRVLSLRRLTLDGEPLRFVSADEPAPDRRLVVLLKHRPGGSAEGPILPQDAIEARLETVVGPGMLERITVVNRSAVASETELTLELAADFADVFEVGRKRRQSGAIEARSADDGALEIRYQVEHGGRRIERGLHVTTEPPAKISAGAGTSDRPSRLAWRLELAPGERWTADVRCDVLLEGRWRGVAATRGPEQSSSHTRGGRVAETERDREWRAWRAERPTVESEPPVFGAIVERAMDDLFALRNREFAGDSADSWVPNAGVARFTGLFGRDALTAGWQSALLGPAISRGALRLLAASQATDDDPFRDAQPGKLLHEARRGPLSELGIRPHAAYYGTQTAPAMFVLALSELWHWTGDTEELRRYRGTALRALEWARDFGDCDGDGFLESVTRSSEGLTNQGWKDSTEAMRYPDGRNAGPPLATVEEQAFHILALERMAEILVALDAEDEAAPFLVRAARLSRQWHEAFWMPDEGFYAMALDREKRQIASIGSNPGHALGAGIVPAEFARQVADRLLEPDLFSGWGVRTLSATHPSYNPFGYHLGTVWPVEQATFALGMKRYGLDEEAVRLVDGMVAAAAGFRVGRLPEVLSGIARDESDAPIPYPDSNSPQAWSASATIQLAQILLGLYPFAPLRMLAVVRPRLPESIHSMTIRKLRVGDAAVSLRFDRRDDGTASHDVIERDGTLLVMEAPPPQDVAPPGGPARAVEAAQAWAIEHAPGQTMRALRIALGLETEALASGEKVLA